MQDPMCATGILPRLHIPNRLVQRAPEHVDLELRKDPGITCGDHNIRGRSQEGGLRRSRAMRDLQSLRADDGALANVTQAVDPHQVPAFPPTASDALRRKGGRLPNLPNALYHDDYKMGDGETRRSDQTSDRLEDDGRSEGPSDSSSSLQFASREKNGLHGSSRESVYGEHCEDEDGDCEEEDFDVEEGDGEDGDGEDGDVDVTSLKEASLSRDNDERVGRPRKRLEEGTTASSDTDLRYEDQYELLETVGEGTYGLVYKAKNCETGKIIALKKIRTSSTQEGLPPTSLREIGLLQNLSHENIIELHSVFQEPISYGSSLPMLFIEFAYYNADLRRFAKRFPQRRLPLATVRLIGFQLLSALDFCHKRQIIHRDVKPSNILVHFRDKALQELTHRQERCRYVQREIDSVHQMLGRSHYYPATLTSPSRVRVDQKGPKRTTFWADLSGSFASSSESTPSASKAESDSNLMFSQSRNGSVSTTSDPPPASSACADPLLRPPKRLLVRPTNTSSHSSSQEKRSKAGSFDTLPCSDARMPSGSAEADLEAEDSSFTQAENLFRENHRLNHRLSARIKDGERGRERDSEEESSPEGQLRVVERKTTVNEQRGGDTEKTKEMMEKEERSALDRVYEGISPDGRIDCAARFLLARGLQIKLADFGLARVFPVPVRPLTHEVVTLWYRAPEILLGFEYYTSSIDIWSVGCVLIELLCGCPPFCGDSEIETLFQMFQLLGTPSEREWPQISTLPHFKDQWPLWPRRRDRYDYLREDVDEDCKDLLDRMLQYPPEKRCTAKEALNHPWFDPIRHSTSKFPPSYDGGDSSSMDSKLGFARCYKRFCETCRFGEP